MLLHIYIKSEKIMLLTVKRYDLKEVQVKHCHNANMRKDKMSEQTNLVANKMQIFFLGIWIKI